MSKESRITTAGQDAVKNNNIKIKEEQNMEQYYIIRCDRAGVFFAKIKSRNGSEAVLTDARRLWEWAGAYTLSDLATTGTIDPRNCKFTLAVPEMLVLGVIEIIPCTDQATAGIQGVKVWKL